MSCKIHNTYLVFLGFDQPNISLSLSLSLSHTHTHIYIYIKFHKKEPNDTVFVLYLIQIKEQINKNIMYIMFSMCVFAFKMSFD